MSRYEKEQIRLFTRRAALIAGGQLAIFAVLGARMFQLQVVEYDQYTTKAENNRINTRLLAPERGVILDRFDVPLAVNIQDFRVTMVSERTPDVDATLDAIHTVVPLLPERRERIKRDLKRQHKFLPVLISDNLTWDQMAAIEVSLLNLPGVMIEEGKVRSYPLKSATAHVLGYVGVANEKDIEKDQDPLLSLPGFQIGKLGLEKQYESILRGTAGQAEEEINASGRSVRILKKNRGNNGKALQLTIDAELQFFTQNRLGSERSASAIIMDAFTGAIYAMASHPAYDPNVFSRGIPTTLWKELLEDPARPLMNKVISGQYPPGSTFKMMTALAGLEAGVISKDRKVFCPGHMDLGSHRFHCWNVNGHGSVNVCQALEESCDVYFYQIALEVGIDRIASVAKRYGLGDRLGLDLPSEQSGLIPTQAWKRQRLKQSWNKGETLVNAIGQGFTLATPLQLAVMTARLVNGGIEVYPYLADQVGDKKTRFHRTFNTLSSKPDHIALIKEGMDDVINGARGTARATKIKDKAYSFGGKTGTSQVRRISMEERRRGMKMDELNWSQQHHALFVGYAPLENPRYVATVVVEHGASGSAAAAPIARDLLLETQKRQPEIKRS